MTKLEIFRDLLEGLSPGEKERFVHLVNMPKPRPLPALPLSNPPRSGGSNRRGPVYRTAKGGRR